VVTYSRKVFIPLTHLCRDRCHYCTFVTTPGQLRAQGKAPFLSPDEVLDVARAGAAMGCKEALFTLGDRPEDRWPVASEWLHAHGFDSTLAYLRAMAIRVLEETGLLPHLNPGVLTWEEIQRLAVVQAARVQQRLRLGRVEGHAPLGADQGAAKGGLGRCGQRAHDPRNASPRIPDPR
jgi:FO synthase